MYYFHIMWLDEDPDPILLSNCIRPIHVSPGILFRARCNASSIPPGHHNPPPP